MRELNRLYKELDDIYHNIALKLNLSDSAFIIFYTLCEVGEGCSQKDICSQAAISKKTINSAIQKLEQENYICMRHGKGRQMQIYLTEKGQKVLQEKIYPVMQIENNVFQKMEEQRRASCCGYFENMFYSCRTEARRIIGGTSMRTIFRFLKPYKGLFHFYRFLYDCRCGGSTGHSNADGGYDQYWRWERRYAIYSGKRPGHDSGHHSVGGQCAAWQLSLRQSCLPKSAGICAMPCIKGPWRFPSMILSSLERPL